MDLGEPLVGAQHVQKSQAEGHAIMDIGTFRKAQTSS